jgi:hypothetical protein
MAVVVPPKVPKYESAQSKFEHLPELPLRQLVVGPSGSGKTVYLTNLVTNFYRGCFERVYIFSPSIWVDDNWKSVMKYQQKEMGVPKDEYPELYHEDYDPAKLQEIIETHKHVVQVAKEKRLRKIPGILVLVDDHADNPAFSKSDKLLHSLFVRGRHHHISSVVSTQKLRAIANIIRVNATSWLIFRLRSQLELDSAIEEISAVYPKQTIEEMYRVATREPYSFLTVLLNAPTPQTMFLVRFSHYLVPTV